MALKPALGAHWFQITATCVKQRIVGKEKIPQHKTSKKHSKQAIRQGKLRKIQNVC